MTELYLEDLEVGRRFTSGSLAVTEAAIKAFAAEFDPQPFHLDEAKARASLFGGLAASGWHTAALTMRLLVDGGAPLAGGILGAGGEIAWPRPTRPGDVLTVESEVLAATPSRSRPDRGMVTLRSETRNQQGDVVQVLTARLVVPRRAPAPGQPDFQTPLPSQMAARRRRAAGPIDSSGSPRHGGRRTSADGSPAITPTSVIMRHRRRPTAIG